MGKYNIAFLLSEAAAVVNFCYRSLRIILIESLIFRLIAGFLSCVRASFRRWFLVRLAKPETGINLLVLNGSAAAKGARILWKNFRVRTEEIVKTSFAVSLMNFTERELYRFPLKFCAIFIITVISVDAFFSIIYTVTLGPFYWMLRGLFLFLAFGGLSCDADWQTIKSGSALVNNLFKW